VMRLKGPSEAPLRALTYLLLVLPALQLLGTFLACLVNFAVWHDVLVYKEMDGQWCLPIDSCAGLRG
jgi:hypothetical protein